MYGTQLAAAWFDGTVIAWSYPSGEIIFQINEHKAHVNIMKWNPFKPDIFVTLHRVRNAVDYLFNSPILYFITWTDANL